MGSMLRALVYDTSIGGVIYVRVVLPTSGCTLFGHLSLWPTVLEEGCIALSDTHSFLEAGVPG